MPFRPLAGSRWMVVLLRAFAWALLLFIAFSTLAPIGLRPITGASPNLERAAAYAVFGFVLALAYPRHLWLGLGAIVLSAVGLELLQLLAASRHARLADAAVKLSGGGVGLAIGMVVDRLIWSRTVEEP